MPSNFFQLSTCDHSPYVTSSLARGWVCRLQLLLTFASAVILRSESRGTHNHILLSQIRDSPPWRARSPYLYPPGTWWPSYTPRHWVPFSSPPTTRRATVEVLEPASTRATLKHMLFNIVPVYIRISSIGHAGKDLKAMCGRHATGCKSRFCNVNGVYSETMESPFIFFFSY
jgi:hypothetical protein